MAQRALISGITGQDGSYLAELLLEHGYEVHGIVRRASTTNYWRVEQILDRIQLRAADLDRLTPLEALNLLAELKKQVASG